MTSHLPSLRSGCPDLGFSLLQYGERLFEEMPSSASGHDEAQDRDRMGLLAVSGNGLHRECSAAESITLDSGVGEETINRNFLHCKRLEKRGVIFFGHRSLPSRLRVTKLTRNSIDAPEIYFATFVPIVREYSAIAEPGRLPTPSHYRIETSSVGGSP